MKTPHKYGTTFLASPEHTRCRPPGSFTREGSVFTLQNGYFAFRCARAKYIRRNCEQSERKREEETKRKELYRKNFGRKSGERGEWGGEAPTLLDLKSSQNCCSLLPRKMKYRLSFRRGRWNRRNILPMRSRFFQDRHGERERPFQLHAIQVGQISYG